MDGTLGSQTAWMLDGSGVCITSGERARGDDPRRRGGRLAGRRARDRRPREPRGARRVRGDARRLAAARAAAADRARAVPRPRGRPSLRRARRRVLRAVQPRARPTATSRSGSGASGSTATYAFRSLVDSGAVVANGSDAPVEELDPLAGIRAGVLRTIDDRPAWRPDAGADGRAGAPRLDGRPGLARGRRAAPRQAAARLPRRPRRPRPRPGREPAWTSCARSRSSRRWSAAAGSTILRPGTEGPSARLPRVRPDRRLSPLARDRRGGSSPLPRLAGGSAAPGDAVRRLRRRRARVRARRADAAREGPRPPARREGLPAARRDGLPVPGDRPAERPVPRREAVASRSATSS